MYKTNYTSYEDLNSVEEGIEALKDIIREINDLDLISQINKVVNIFKNNSDVFRVLPNVISYSDEDKNVNLSFLIQDINTGIIYENIGVEITRNDIIINENKTFSIKDKEIPDNSIINLEEYLIYLPNQSPNLRLEDRKGGGQ